MSALLRTEAHGDAGIFKTDVGIEVFHALHEGFGSSTDTRRVVGFVICEGLMDTAIGLCYVYFPVSLTSCKLENPPNNWQT
jgi:hypothetical protein